MKPSLSSRFTTRKATRKSSGRGTHRNRQLLVENLEHRALLTGGIMVTDTQILAPHDTIPRFVGVDAIHSVRSGDWSDPTTWSSNQVPGADDQVRVSAATSVVYDLDSQVELDAVEVLGRLEFATDQDTSLYLNELMVLPGGSLVVGTEQQPVLPQFTAEIVFTDTPDALGNHFKTGTVESPGQDPFQYGNGLLVLDGEVTMHGAPLSDTFVRLSAEPLAGDQVLTLETPVTGWRPGDSLIIPDTRQVIPFDIPNQYTYQPQWEQVTIASVDGNTVTLSEPLEFSHHGARDADGTPTVLEDGTRFLPHVANLTRNVVLRSENPDGVRGHAQFYHRTSKDIRYVQFRDLGRTDALPLDNTVRDADGNITHIGTNQVGRYSDHNHHLWGPVDGMPAPPGQSRDSYQLIEVGNSFVGGLKWATAAHGSHYGLYRDNVYYDIDGSAVATEDGSETGNEFVHNFVVRTNGFLGEPKRAEADQGDMGDAFWLAGPFNIVEDNVTANIYRNAFTVFPDHIPYMRVNVPNFPGANMHDASQVTTVNVREFGQQNFRGNEIYGASNTGVVLWRTGDVVRYPNTATPNVVDDTRVWHLSGSGLWQYYAASFEINDWVQRGDPKMIGAPTQDGGTNGIPFTNIGIGSAGADAAFSVLSRADIQGLETGYLNRGRGVADELVIRDSYLDNFANVVNWKWSQAPLDGSRDLIVDNVIFGDALSPGGNNTVVMDLNPPSQRYLTVRETHQIRNFNGLQGQDFHLYYEQQAPDFPMPDGTCGDALGVTNEQCWDLHGLATAGEVAPSRELDGDNGELGAVRARALGVSGLAYELPETLLQTPRLYVNFEQQGNTKTAYYAVTGNTSQVAGVRLRVGGVEFQSTELIGTFDVSSLANGTYDVAGTLVDTSGAETGNGTAFDVQLPVKDRSQFRQVNQAPVLEALGDQEVTANHTLRFTVRAHDPDGDTITYSAASLPDGASFDPATGVFEWTPSNTLVGEYALSFTASDGRLSSTEQVAVTVHFDASVDGGRVADWDFSGSTGTLLHDTSVYMHHGEILGGGQFVDGALVLDGVDDFVQMPKSIALEPVQELTVAVRFTTSGTNYFRPLVAYDGGSVSSFAIMVFDNGYANRFGETGQGFWIQLNTESNGPFNMFVPFNDWDGEVDVALTFKNTETSGEVRVYVNGQELAASPDAGRNIRYTSWRNQRVQLGHSSAGFWAGSISGAQLYGRALDASEIRSLFNNTPPVLEPVPDQTVAAGTPLSLTFQANDVEGDSVTLSAENLPAGAAFDASTGTLTWTPTSQQIGDHLIRVTASDGQSTASLDVAISVVVAALGDWNALNVSGSTWSDSSSSGYDGTIHGGASLQGGALVLDGSDDFVQLPQTAQLQPVEELTVAVRLQSSGNNYFRRIVGYDGGSVPSFGVDVLDKGSSSYFGEVGQGFHVQFQTVTKGAQSLYVPFKSWGQPLDIALTFRNTETSGEVRFYINGVEVAANLDAGHDIRYTPWGSQSIQFGRSKAGYWQGKLYHAQLHDRALSSDEIGNLF